MKLLLLEQTLPHLSGERGALPPPEAASSPRRNMLIDLVVVDHSRDFCSALDAELRDARNACSAPVAVRVLCGDLSSSFGVATASDEFDDAKCPDDEFEKIACEPIILDDQTPTCVVFGGNTAGVAAGNAQRAISRAFPRQFHEIATQVRNAHASDWDDECWPQESVGSLYASSTLGGVRLVSCSVFPRDARCEQETVRRVFRDALIFVAAEGARCEPPLARLRVVTHGLGVFIGHPDPAAFACAMVRGLADFVYALSDDGVLRRAGGAG